MMRMRAGFVTESVLLPLLGAKFSMRTKSSLGRQIPRKRSRGRLDRLANIIDDTLHERRVVTLGHHPNQRLGPRLANHQTALALELRLGRRNAFPDTVHLQRRAAVEPHVLEELWQR